MDSLDLGDVPTWLAFLVPTIIAALSWLKARKATSTADRAVENGKRQADALERLADTASKRIAQAEQGSPESAEAKFAFEFEPYGAESYTLRNVGTEAVTNVRVGGHPAVTTSGIGEVNLPPLRSMRVHLPTTFGSGPAPGELTVTANELPQPMVVRLPPYGKAAHVW